MKLIYRGQVKTCNHRMNKIIVLICMLLLSVGLLSGCTEQEIYNSNGYDKQTVLSWDMVPTAAMYHVEISNSPSFDNAFFNASDVNKYNYPDQVEVIGSKMYFIPYQNQRIATTFHWQVRPYAIENPEVIV